MQVFEWYISVELFLIASDLISTDIIPMVMGSVS